MIKNLFERKFVKFYTAAVVFALLAMAIAGNVVVKDGQLNITG